MTKKYAVTSVTKTVHVYATSSEEAEEKALDEHGLERR
jgi:hypothetical protein